MKNLIAILAIALGCTWALTPETSAQEASVPPAATEPSYASIDEAIARGDLDDVKRHLQANPQTVHQGKHPKLSPLQQAILRSKTEIAETLIEAKADINQVDGAKRTPLHLAVDRKNLPLVQELLKQGALPNLRDRVGWTPLHHAAAKDQPEIATALLEGGADIKTLSDGGGTALHEAAASGGAAMVALLLDHGVDPGVVSKTGDTAIMIARERNNTAAINALSPPPPELDWKPTFNDKPVSAQHQESIEQALPAQAIVEPKAKRRLLVVSATAGYRHPSIPTGKLALERLGEKTDAYEATLSDDPAHFEVEALKQFDAVLLLSPTRDFFMPSHKQRDQFSKEDWDQLQQRHNRLVDNLIEYVKQGGGLVGIHAATDSCYNHKAYGETMGGYFDGHPWCQNHQVTIVVEDPEHATMKPVFGDMKDFELVEEIYQFREDPYSRERLRVLLHVDPERSAKVKGLKRTDNDYAVAWVQSVGEGRVFYSSIGHNHHIYWNPLMLKHYLAGIQFAMGDLEAETAPSNPPSP